MPSVIRVQGDGSDDVARDVVLHALLSQHVREPHQSHLGGTVVGLAEVAEHAGGGGGEDEATVLVLLHGAEGGLGDEERPLEVDIQHALHLFRLIFAKLRSRRMPALLTTMSTRPKLSSAVFTMASPPLGRRHGIMVGDRRTPVLLDLVDDEIRRCRVRPRAVGSTAEVVHHDQGAASGKFERVRPAEAAAGAGR